MRCIARCAPGFLVAVLSALGCGGESMAPPPPPAPPIAGVYQLVSIEGLQLPALVDSFTSNEDVPPAPIELGCEAYVTAGVLSVMANGGYTRMETTMEGDCDDPSDDQAPLTKEWSGTWNLTGNQLSVEGFGAAGGTLADGTWNDDEISLVYRSGLFRQIDTLRVFRR